MKMILSIIAGILMGELYYHAFEEGYPKFILFSLFVLHLETLFLIQVLL